MKITINYGRRVSFEIGLHVCHVTPFDIMDALTMSALLPVRTPAVRIIPLVIACSSRSHMNQSLLLSICSVVLDLRGHLKRKSPHILLSVSSFEGTTYLMKCPHRWAKLDTKHKSQRYDKIGQWHVWKLTRLISHGPTSPPRICRNRTTLCRLTSGHRVSS